MWYFKKSVPKTPLYLKNGQLLKFETLDNLYGYRSVQMEELAKELREAARRGKGGLTEIDQAEYEEFLKKKQPGIKPPTPWREEIGAPPPLPTHSPSVSPAVNNEVATATPPPPPPPPPPSSESTAPKVVKPTIGRRVKKS